MVDERAAGGLAGRPDRTLLFGAAGVPVSQGSMAAAAKGVVKRSNASELLAWRAAIHRAFSAITTADWVNPDCPIRLHCVLTMPKPARWGVVADQTSPIDGEREFPARVTPSTRPDLDKLVRAVGDALAPSDRRRAYADDGRIVELMSVKTYPRPEHVHPWALGEPGVVIRVCPADVEVEFPPLTLREPGPVPDELIAQIPPELLGASAPHLARVGG